jgi:hypothetical protein
MEATAHIWSLIQLTLRAMGEASVQAGKPYGLRGYGDYHRELFPGSFRKTAWEEPITAGLALGLRAKHVNASTERRYPNSQERCDLLIQDEQLGSFWIEFKTAYREGIRGYEANGFKEFRGKSSWQAGVGDIAAKDIIKLNSLPLSAAQHVGVLLLGFDREARPLLTEELYAVLPAELRTSWKAAHDNPEGVRWPDCYPVRAAKGLRDRLWFWHRPVKA